MPDPLPGSGTISISEIATFYEGGTEDLSLSALSENLEPQPEGCLLHTSDAADD